uniref:Uncharacterized protein n=1 Tax=viral metagenome TaxID=1070528 RepID=A0A6M3XY49_9ZZZZ
MKDMNFSFFCSRCTKRDMARPAVVILNGNSLCLVCWSEKRPDIISPEEVREIQGMVEETGGKDVGRKEGRWI